jgi:hypothetical protein
MEEIIPLVLSFNKKYIPYAKVTINSILKRTSSKIKLYCFGLDLDESDFNYFKILMEKNSGEFKRFHFNSEQLSAYKDIAYLTKTTYLRIFIPRYIEEDKVIYTDCDILFLSDISELFKIPFEDNYILAVEDWSYQNRDYHPFDRPEKLDLSDIYVNCGMMVVNNKALKQIDFESKCLEINDKYYDVLKCADQCILNKLFEGKKKLISNSWNCQFLGHVNNLNQILPKFALHCVGENKLWMSNRVIPTNHEFWLNEGLSYGLNREELGIIND